MVVGFLGGTWLIHTTIRRREILELAERAGEVAKRLFFVLVGSALFGPAGGPFFRIAPILPFAAAFLLVRGVARALGAATGRYVAGESLSLRAMWKAGLHPLGSLAVGLAVQTLYLPIQLSHNTLVAGALLSIFLSQALPVPPLEVRSTALMASRPKQQT